MPDRELTFAQAVREALKLTPGEKMRVLHFGNRVELLRVRDAKDLRGLLAGMDTTIERDTDSRRPLAARPHGYGVGVGVSSGVGVGVGVFTIVQPVYGLSPQSCP